MIVKRFGSQALVHGSCLAMCSIYSVAKGSITEDRILSTLVNARGQAYDGWIKNWTEFLTSIGGKSMQRFTVWAEAQDYARKNGTDLIIGGKPNKHYVVLNIDGKVIEYDPWVNSSLSAINSFTDLTDFRVVL